MHARGIIVNQRHFTLKVPPSTQVYKWVPANLLLGGNSAIDQHPIQGGVAIFLVISCYRKQDKLQYDEPLGSYTDLPFTIAKKTVTQ